MSEALNDLNQHISEQQTAHPDAFLILAGDFNHVNPNTVFPQLHGHVSIPRRGTKILNNVFTTHKEAYKALPLPHLGASEHTTGLDTGGTLHTHSLGSLDFFCILVTILRIF